MMAPTSDPWQSCRFCLRANAGMRSLPGHDLLPHTEVAQLFEEVTGSPLDFSPGYSQLLCAGCEQRLRSAAQVRADFLSVAQRWQEIIRDGSMLYVKTEYKDDGAAGIEAEFSGDFDMMFVNCKMDDTQDVNNWLEERAARPTLKIQESLTVEDGSVQKYEDDVDDDQFNDNTAVDWLEDPDDIRPPNDDGPKNKTAAVRIPTVMDERRAGPRLEYMVPPSGVELTCDICTNKFYTRVNLLYHMRVQHGPKSRRNCNICGQTNIRQIKRHMLSHQARLKCDYCDETFVQMCKKRAHERKHTRERPIICDKCGFVFSEISGLNKHMLLHANDEKGTKFTKQQVFRTRVTPCADDESPPVSVAKQFERDPQSMLPCPICERPYANRPGLQLHMKTKHGDEGVAAWKHYRATVCVVCSAQCSDPKALREHRRIHQAFQCDICMRTFDTRVTWELHTRMHVVRPRPFVCEICESKHHTQYALKVHHRRAHTNERPYPCVQCDRTFVDTTEMRAHVRKTHVEPVNRVSHKCTVCPPEAAPFSSKHTLRKHMEIHTGESRFRCEVCSKRQPTTIHLLEHMRQYHPDELFANTVLS